MEEDSRRYKLLMLMDMNHAMNAYLAPLRSSPCPKALQKKKDCIRQVKEV